MAEAKLAQKPPDRRTMDLNTAAGQLTHQFIKGQIAVLFQTMTNPIFMRAQLGVRPAMALTLGRKRTGLTLQNNHVVDEPHRHTEMSRRCPVRVPFFNKIDNTRAQFKRMWLAHSDPPAITKENQNNPDLPTMNPIKQDTL